MFLRQILRSVTEAAGIIAVVAVQSDSTASAVAARQYSTMLAEMSRNPFDAKALNVAVAARNLDMISEEAQASNIGALQFDIGLTNTIGIVRDDVAQVIDTD